MTNAPITERIGPDKTPQESTERLAADPARRISTPEAQEILGYVKEQRNFQVEIAWLDAVANIDRHRGLHRLG